MPLFGRRKSREDPEPAAGAAPDDADDPEPNVADEGLSRISARFARKTGALAGAEEGVVAPTEDEVLSRLDPGFFEPATDFDAASHVLARVPSASDTDTELDVYLLSQISLMDMASDVVTSKLAKHIQANYNEFIGGMRQVQQVDLDLARANIQATNSRRQLANARQRLAEGPLLIVRKQRQRDRLGAAMDTVLELRKLLGMERALREAMDSGDFPRAVELCLETRFALEADELKRLDALAPMQRRMESMLPALRHRVDLALERVCGGAAADGEGFDALAFERVVRAYMMLDEQARLADDDAADEPHSGDEPDGIAGMGERIQRAFLKAVERRSKAAVVATLAEDVDDDDDEDAPSDDDGDNEERPQRETKLPQAQAQALEDLCALLQTPRRVLAALSRLYEAIADVLHQNYCLLQWLRDPLAEKNGDAAYLHRALADSLDDLDSDDDDDDDLLGADDDDDALSEEERYARALAHTSSLAARRARAEKRQLVVVRASVRSGRKVVWDRVQRVVSGVLNAAAGVPMMKLEHFVRLLTASQQLIELGEQFSHSDSHSLHGCLRLKSKQFFDAAHKDAFDVMRLLLDSERWQRVPLALDRVGGIFGVVSKEFVGLSQLAESAHLQQQQHDHDEAAAAAGRERRASAAGPAAAAAREQPLLAAFAAKGNPFADSELLGSYRREARRRRRRQAAEEGAGEGDDDDDDESDGPDSVGEEDDDELAEFGGGLARANTEDEDELERAARSGDQDDMLLTPDSEPQPTAQPFGSRHVITGAALSGFARFTGRYLQIMHSLDPVAAEAFVGLTQLFDFYLYAVVTLFLPEAALASLFGAPGADPLLRADEQHVAALRATVARIRDELAPGAPLPAAGAGEPVAAPTAAAVPVRLTRAPSGLEAANERTCYALAERCVATESLLFVLEVLNTVRPTLESLLPAALRGRCVAFYERSAGAVVQLRRLMYAAVAPTIVDAPLLAQQVAEARWEIKTFAEEANAYVPQVVTAYRNAWGRLQALCESSALPDDVRTQLWAGVVQAAMEQLVEGFSRVKKCSAEGRALMLMDLRELHDGLQAVHAAEPHRGRMYVDSFVRAFYFTEEDVLRWVEQNRDHYQLQQLTGLVIYGVGAKLKKKRQRELVAAVEAAYSA